MTKEALKRLPVSGIMDWLNRNAHIVTIKGNGGGLLSVTIDNVEVVNFKGTTRKAILKAIDMMEWRNE